MHRLVLALCAAALLAQSNLSTITGIVTDPTGAVVAACEVSIVNTETGLVSRAATNASGTYNAPSLVPGQYRVEMQAAGFKKKQIGGVVLQTGQELRLDAALEIGAVSESVEVQATVTPLQQESAEISETYTSNEIQNMPINGRSPYALLDLAAGVVASGDDPSEPDYAGNSSINGSRKGTNAFTVDGASTVHVGGIGERVGSIESISEFKLYSHTYSAEFGRTSGGVVQFQVKSGTQKLHGTAYEYRRESAFNANSWANNARGIQQESRSRNEFGATLGGPVPFLKNRAFIFLSYEGIRDQQPITRMRTIPAGTVRTGNFAGYSTVINDPLSSAAFPGNVIPASRLDRAALKFLELFPEPNSTGSLNTRYGIRTSNWVRSTASLQPGNYAVTRTDYNPTEKDKIFLTFSIINEGPRDEGRDFENVLNTVAGPRTRDMRRATFGYTRFLKPNLTNEYTVFIQRDPRMIDPWNPDYDVTSQLGIQRKVGQAMPQIQLSGGYGNYGNSGIDHRVVQPGGMTDSVTWLRNRHTLKFGAQVFQNQFWYESAGAGSGSYAFNGELTGLGLPGRDNPINSLADLLLGAVKTAQAPVPQIGITRANYNLGLFVNDTWKVTRRLNLNLGLRYEFETRQIVKNNVYSRIDTRTGQLLVAGRNASRNLNLENDYFNLSPRFGAAYSLDKDTVVRTGFAVFRSNFWVDNGNLVSYPGWTYTQSYVDQGLGRAQQFRLSEGFPVSGASVPDPLELFRAATVQRPLSVGAASYGPTKELPRTVQWNFGVQRAVGWRTVVDMAYVASRSTNLARSVPSNNPMLDRAAEVSIQRVPIQQVRPFPALTAFNSVWYDGSSWYNALQFKAVRRFHAGFSLNASFTFSKNMDTVSAVADSFQIPWQYPEIERALSSLDRTRSLGLGWVWDLPFGKNRPFFSGNRAVSMLLAGFQVNGILKVADGLPFTITQRSTNLILSAQRPDVIDPSKLSGRVKEPSFNGSSRRWLIAPTDPGFPFVQSGPTAIGNLGRNTSREPGFVNLNLSIFREFRLSERFKLQFRGEGYNALNHVNYREPANTEITNANFGLINQAATARQVQLGLRLSF